MCGIAGLIADNDTRRDNTIRAMVSALYHRGPDDEGFFSHDRVALGMRRLAVIHLATGTQPLRSEDGDLVILYNGEIYNYRELAEQLTMRGTHLKTRSDIEVLLKMYQTYSSDMFLQLRGMFALCIYDKARQVLILARDLFGIKPLYYAVDNDQVIAFSSEIKSLLHVPRLKPEVNDAAAYNYLSFQYNPLDETFFKNVFKLPPGHFMEIDIRAGTRKLTRYSSFEFRQDHRFSESEAKRAVAVSVEDSIRHHLISDVPVGAFLSGGIDSAINATLMQKALDETRVTTFTLGFPEFSEGPEARQVSRLLQSNHNEIIVSKRDFFSALPDAVWHLDEPVADPSALGLYFLCREARKQVTVVLSGEGADELFGGYNVYLEPFARRKLSWVPVSLVEMLLSIPLEFRGKNLLRRLRSGLTGWYIGNASIFSKNEVDGFWKGPGQQRFSLDHLYQRAAHLSDSTKMQYVDIHTWLPGDILAKADKMSMAHSIELRVPFLDRKVAELTRSLPDRCKWRGRTTKYLLREAFRSMLPKATRKRRKLGFPVPLRYWLDASLQPWYDAILNNKYIRSRMDLAYIEKLIQDHVTGSADNARKIYVLLTLAVWHDVFFGNGGDRDRALDDGRPTSVSCPVEDAEISAS